MKNMQPMDISELITQPEKIKDISIGLDEPAEKLEKDIQAKSLTNEVKFTTSNKFCSSTVKNYLPILMWMSIVHIDKHAVDKDLLNEIVPNQVKSDNEIIFTNNW